MRLAAFVLCALALVAGTPGQAGQTFAFARAPYAYRFPADHWSHPDYQNEWWYFTGHLRARGGRRFGFELTFFRIGLRPGDPISPAGQSRWRGNQVYAAHFALTDERARHFAYSERFAREALGLASASSAALDVRVGDWYVRGSPLKDARFEKMRLHARDEMGGLDLEVLPLKPPAIHGRDGVSRKGACVSCASHYYSYTRLRTRGRLHYNGADLAVDGTSWMDHEFGSEQLEPGQIGWDWFAFQLDDGREVMLYLLRRKDGSISPQSSGSLVERDGRVRYLSRGDFHGGGSRSVWHSARTGASYPNLWEISIPSAGLDLQVIPVMADQELAARDGGVSYWEGAVDLRDTDSPAARSGSGARGVGYVELTGYAGPFKL